MIIKTVKSARELIVCSEAEFSELSAMADAHSLSNIIDALTALQEMAESLTTSASRSDVELVIVKLCSPELASTLSSLKAKVERLEKTVAALSQGKAVAAPVAATPTGTSKPKAEDIPLPDAPPPTANEPEQPKAVSKAAPTVDDGEPVPVAEWPEILEILKLSCPLMAGVLTDSKAYIGNGRLLIDSQLEQFKELINSDAKYRDYIRKAAEQVLGVSYNLGPYKRPVAPNERGNVVDPLAEFAKSLNS